MFHCYPLRLTFSFASTSDEALDGSDGQTAGLGHGSMLSEALQGKYKSYSSAQEPRIIYSDYQIELVLLA